jgi:iron complex transport system ATP-binding protein
MTALAVSDVSVELGGAPVVDRVSLAVEPGEWIALLGPNGAGKTSLLRAAAGLVRFSGEIMVAGERVERRSARRIARHLALVPQNPITPGEMTVAEYVLLGRTPHISYLGAEGPADRRAAASAVRRLDLDALAHRLLSTLSGGERQRVVLARALAQEASVLLLDEPTSALDVGHQQHVLELVDALRREHGLAVLSAMHELTLAGQYADQLVLLASGRIAATGSPREVLTEEALSTLYEARVRVIEDGGQFVVVPVRQP